MAGDARHQGHQVERIATVEGQLLDGLGIQHIAERGLGGLHLRARARHRDLLGNGARIERDVDGQRLPDLQLIPSAGEFLEPLHRHRNGVLAKRHGFEIVLARRIGLHGPFEARVLMKYDDFRSGHDRAGGVRHHATNARGNGLG